MSGVELNGSCIRKRRRRRDELGQGNRVVRSRGSAEDRRGNLQLGRTPLVVARDQQISGVIHLKDVVKGGMRSDSINSGNGLRTVMITAPIL